uniref:Uncharacterized protein n=1 Tax=Cyprinus carpio carpio TaxID=630221 RepID=A0A8C0YKZ9_CYPCA
MLCLAYIYGDIMTIDTTGASEATAKQYKLTIKAENHDLARVEKYKNMITKVGKAKKMDLAVIAAMISRESRAGAVLKNGWEPAGNVLLNISAVSKLDDFFSPG